MRPNWQRMLSCAYTTQLLHSTGEVCWNNSDCYFIWLNLCEGSRDIFLFGLNLCAGSRDNSFQEVLKAVLFGGWSISPTAHDWLLCGSPIRVSTTFILSVGLILFALSRISNNV